MNPADIKTIFFDLDDTLFDHTRAQRSALRQMLRRLPGRSPSVETELFLRTYDRINAELWYSMAAGRISAAQLKVMRLQQTFAELNIPPVNFQTLSHTYLQIYNQQTFAVDHADIIINYLHGRYVLGILSNGFDDIQEAKLDRMALQGCFDYCIYSGQAGAMKPSPAIFDAALSACGNRPDEAVYVGDCYATDVVGAKRAGWSAVHFSPVPQRPRRNGAADYQIASLLQLKEIFPDRLPE
jgi:putative hydrolase of the HAD superfamily